jgi:hypothetical protein
MTFSAWVSKWLAQFAHVGWGAFLALAVGKFTHAYIGFLVVLAVAAIKEFIFDPLTETPGLSGGLKGDEEDFLFWLVGAGLGMLVAAL